MGHGLKAGGGGFGILVGSIGGRAGRARPAFHAAPKDAVMGLVKALAPEPGSSGSTVDAIAPGVFATGLNAEFGHDPAFQRRVAPLTALGRPTSRTGRAGRRLSSPSP